MTRAAATERTGPAGPLIILTYAHAGAETLAEYLSASSLLACTSGTGVLPLCHEALSTWQQTEGRGGPPSQLAIKSVRALLTSMIIAIQASSGASLWCETAFTDTVPARSFLRVFPSARFLCLHRSLQGLYTEAARAYPWGLGSSPFWPYSGGHPGNNAATVAAFWAARTEALLSFEAEHTESCHRLRYEDLCADSPGQFRKILAAVGVDSADLTRPGQPAGTQTADHQTGDTGEPLPADWIPALLLAKVRELHARLGYHLTDL